MIRRRRLLLLLALSMPGLGLPRAALAQIAPSAPLDVAGVRFERELPFKGTKLLLNGAGIRYKFVIKVYAAALYVPAPVTTPEAAWDTATPRVFKVVMLRDIDANELGKLFTSGMEKNATREEFTKAIPGTLKLADIFSARKKLLAGDSFTIEWQPGTGTTIAVNGKPESEPIVEPAFFSALMKIWLGKSPADTQLKDALLAAKP